LSRLAVYNFWNFVLAFLLNYNERPHAIPCGRICNKNRNKVELRDFETVGKPFDSPNDPVDSPAPTSPFGSNGETLALSKLPESLCSGIEN
jgi:hypothetical protein